MSSSSSHQLNAKNAVVGFDKSVTFSSGTTSTVVDLKGTTLVGFRTPASLASTSITFSSGDATDGTFLTLKDKDNAAYTVTVDTSAAQVYVDPSIFAGVRFLKLEAGSSETSKTITLATRPIV